MSVRMRAGFIERSTGEILLGPPKSRAGRRVVDRHVQAEQGRDEVVGPKQ
jgi:hypothetical protein